MPEPTTARDPARNQCRDLCFVGDLHGQFDDEDLRYLDNAGYRLTIFIGDLGDEDVKMARRVAKLPFETRCILGNHDAWRSFREKAASPALRESLELLAERHLAYDVYDLDEQELSIVGARPFSWGGPSLRSPELYKELYDVVDHESSAAKIVEAAERASYRDLCIVAHNGPYGLSKRSSDIFGKDFGRPGGDWGDRDLQMALRTLEQRGFRIPLVVAGHMHHQLLHPRGDFRKRCLVRGETVFVNVARVPRIFKSSNGETIRHYARARFLAGRLRSLTELYVGQSSTREVTLFGSEDKTGGQQAGLSAEH